MIKEYFNIKGKTALVTGGGQGIGRAICLALAEHGAGVIINYRSNRREADETRRQLQSLGAKTWLWEYDLNSPTLSADFRRFIHEQACPADILVLNASVQIRREWHEVTPEEFTLQMNVNTRASLELIQCCVPWMEQKGWGRILTLGSVQQKRPSRQMIAYAASKAAQRNMVKNLAWILGEKGVTVNNLSPGVIETARNRDVLADPAARSNIEKKIPLRHTGQPSDTASMALLLCSDAGRYITGADIYVDGGMNLPE
jgi:NAD(P)-dependent dehydrogenase (short-subunit alcohol dehydrogenase family)